MDDPKDTVSAGEPTDPAPVGEEPEDTTVAEQTDAKPAVPDSVECLAALDPPIRMFIVAVMFLGFGLYCVYDAHYALDKDGAPKYSVEKNAANYYFNVVCGYILPPIGLVAAVWGVRMLRRVFVADQEGLGFVGKDIVSWGDITKLVKRDRGLLDVHYQRQATRGKLKLDSWKLKNYDDLILLLEAKTPNVPVETAKKAVR